MRWWFYLAVSKILNMKDCGNAYHGKHLKVSLDYIMNPEKTQNGKLIGGVNCQPELAYKQMKSTKKKFLKEDKRQGYHFIISFKEDEVDSDVAFEITEKFVKEYIGNRYEAVYVVHDNTDHIHSHIIMNSVSFVDGKKYRNEKGDWAKYIQPITNRLCEEYGLSIIDLEEERSNKKRTEHYKEWNEIRDGKFVWSDMIKRDIDACIIQSDCYEAFINMLQEKGYRVKEGKYLAVLPPGMQRYRRCETLGHNYSKDMIVERIQKEDLAYYQGIKESEMPRIVNCYVRRYKRTKLSGLQKKYYAKLYRLGKIKRKAYSQAWKYKDEIKKMHRLQEEYLFLSEHCINSLEQLVASFQNISEKKKEVSKEKSKLFKERNKFNSLFNIADRMLEIECANEAFESGDLFFDKEHREWEELQKKLETTGYSFAEILRIKEFYHSKIGELQKKEAYVRQQLNIANGIIKELSPDINEESRDKVESLEKEKIRTKGSKDSR